MICISDANRLAQMMEISVQAMLRRLFEDLFRTQNLTQLTTNVRSRALYELMEEIEGQIQLHGVRGAQDESQ